MKRSSMMMGLLVVYSLIMSLVVVGHDQKINEQERVFLDASESIVMLQHVGNGGGGTGFAVNTKSGKQVIVTNAHVCEISPFNPVFIVYHREGTSLRKKKLFPAMQLSRDTKHDLCILSVPKDLNISSLKLASDFYIDESVHIVGYPIAPLLSASSGYIRGFHSLNMRYDLPLLLCTDERHSIKTVPIKQKNGKIIETDVCFVKNKFLFTDAIGDSGQSGSPALNKDGEIIGVMSAVLGIARPFSLLVPLSDLQDFLSKH